MEPTAKNTCSSSSLPPPYCYYLYYPKILSYLISCTYSTGSIGIFMVSDKDQFVDGFKNKSD